MAIDRVKETLRVYETLCEMMNSRVLSSGTLRQLEELKARLELEIAELKKNDPRPG